MTVLKASDYPKFRPIPRLHRKVVLTEKIDGSNGLIAISLLQNVSPEDARDGVLAYGTDGLPYVIRAGSRNRWLSPGNDNFGFARWVYDNAEELTALGEGRHYGEWFGKGIQSGYGLDEKRFALFNTKRWFDARRPLLADFHNDLPDAKPAPSVVTVVPVLNVVNGSVLNWAINDALHTLESTGSFISPLFMKPEGVVAYHDAAGTYFKATIKNDEAPKSTVKSK